MMDNNLKTHLYFYLAKIWFSFLISCRINSIVFLTLVGFPPHIYSFNFFSKQTYKIINVSLQQLNFLSLIQDFITIGINLLML